MSPYALTTAKLASVLIAVTSVCGPYQKGRRTNAPIQKWQVGSKTLVRTGFDWSLQGDSRVFWKSEGLESSLSRAIICVPTATFAVTCAENIKLVRTDGTVLGKYPLWAAGDPRVFHQAGRSFICSEGARVVGVWDRANGLTTLNWLRSQRILRCVSFKNGRTLWTSNEIDFGVPIGFLKDGRIISLRILDPNKTFSQASRREVERRAKYEVVVSMTYSAHAESQSLVTFTSKEKYEIFYDTVLSLDGPEASATLVGRNLKLNIGSGEVRKIKIPTPHDIPTTVETANP